MWKFGGKTKFPQIFGQIARNYAFPQNFHTRKLGKNFGNLHSAHCTQGAQKEISGMKWVNIPLTLLRRRPLSYRSQSIDLRSQSIHWFLYDNGLSHGRVK